MYVLECALDRTGTEQIIQEVILALTGVFKAEEDLWIESSCTVTISAMVFKHYPKGKVEKVVV